MNITAGKAIQGGLLLSLTIALTASGCAGHLLGAREDTGPPPTPGSYQLLEKIEGIPSEVLAARSPREDLFIQTMTGSPTPAEITSGQTQELVLGPNMRVSLAGDDQGLEGWSVNNLVLFEVLVNESVVARFVIGFHDPIYMNDEMLESVGGYSPRFDPRTPIITQRLPTGVPFVLRATALDYRTVGAVTDLWVIIEDLELPDDFGELRDYGSRH